MAAQALARPVLGELRPSEITADKVKEYREHIHTEDEQIRTASENGRPLSDARTGQRLRTLGNRSINETLRTLALILDDLKTRAGSNATSLGGDEPGSRSNVVATAARSTSRSS